MAYCYEKKTDRKGNIYIEITGYEGSIRHLVIPAMMEIYRCEALENTLFPAGRICVP